MLLEKPHNMVGKAFLAILLSLMMLGTIALPAFAGAGLGENTGGATVPGNPGGNGNGNDNSSGGGGSGGGGSGGGGSGGSGGGGTNPGGGGGSGPPSWCVGAVGTAQICDTQIIKHQQLSAGGGCAPKQGPGALGGKNIGYLERIATYTLMELDDSADYKPVSSHTYITTLDCYYSESWDDQTLYCVDKSTVGINMVAPGRKGMGSASKSSAFAGNRTIPNCLSSGQYLELYVDVGEFGRYLAEASTVGRSCTARYYRSANDMTGAKPADSIVSCGGQYTMDSSQSKLQIDCVNGVTRGWTNPQEYTAQSCLDEGMSKLKCDVGDTPLFNKTARKSNVEAFRDGNKNTVEWDKSRIVGDNLVKDSITGTHLKRSGTPWNSEASATSNKQVAYVEYNGKNALGSKLSGNVNKFDVGFYKASNPGSKFKLQPTYDHQITFKSDFARITGYQPFGEIEFDTYQKNVTATGDCTSKPINIDVLRSVNG